jgi:hypothetical protein
MNLILCLDFSKKSLRRNKVSLRKRERKEKYVKRLSKKMKFTKNSKS